MLPELDLSPLVARSLLPHFLKAVLRRGARRVEKWPCVKGWDAVTRSARASGASEASAATNRLACQTNAASSHGPAGRTGCRRSDCGSHGDPFESSSHFLLADWRREGRVI